MVNELETFIGPNGLPTQIFQGKIYQLHPYDPRYFQISTACRLHVVVWSFYNGGKPPKKHHVHHKDENKHNNHPSNLELKSSSEHIRGHTAQRIKDDPEWFQDLAKKGQTGAAKWSKTPEGRAFRQKHAQEVLFQYHEHLFKREVEKNCEVCGNKYVTTNLSAINSRFCSNNCKSQFRRDSGVDDVSRTCAHCSNPFTVNKYMKTKYCSRSCAAEHQWVKKNVAVSL